ncbi:hypothetical protein [Parasphingorhabdus pacifica]
MGQHEAPGEDLPPDVDRVLMPKSVRDGLMASLRRVDNVIAASLAPADEPPTDVEVELMARINDWTEHSERVQRILRHVTTDEDRIAHLDFPVDLDRDDG